MAILTVQTITRGVVATYGPAAGGGDRFARDSQPSSTFLHVRNNGTADVTVTMQAKVSCSHGFNHDDVQTVPLARNAVQTVTITGTPAGGSFTLTLDGVTTAAIAWNAVAAAVQTALEALSNIGVGNVTVTGAGPYTVTFTGRLANRPVNLMTATPSFTGGTAPAVTVANNTLGSENDRMIGPVESRFVGSDGFVDVTYSLAPGVTVAAVKFPAVV